MATLTDVQDGFVEQLEIALSCLYQNNLQVIPKIAKGYPAKNCLDALPGGIQKQQPLISITNPPNAGKDVTRFFPDRISGVDLPPSISAALSKDYLGVGDTATITLSLVSPATTVQAGDGVGLKVESAGAVSGGVAWAEVAQTVTTLAAALAADINSRNNIKNWLSATSLAGVVTVTNISGAPVPLSAAIGNTRVDLIRFHRSLERFDIKIWAGSNEVKDLIGNQIEPFLSSLQRKKMILDSGETVTIRSFTRFPDYTGNVSNIYRDVFIVYAEYAVTEIDKVYAILILNGSVS